MCSVQPKHSDVANVGTRPRLDNDSDRSSHDQSLTDTNYFQIWSTFKLR